MIIKSKDLQGGGKEIISLRVVLVTDWNAANIGERFKIITTLCIDSLHHRDQS